MDTAIELLPLLGALCIGIKITLVEHNGTMWNHRIKLSAGENQIYGVCVCVYI